MSPWRAAIAGALVVIAGALVAAAPARADVTPPPAQKDPAGAPVPRVLLDEWRKADNRATCAPVFVDDLGPVAGARARRTTFSGGWGIVLDKPGLPGRGKGLAACPRCGRSVVGIAGAGVVASAADVARWSLHKEWPNGMRAGYGLEGFDIGPDWLAYVVIPGQRCLYNVWSFLGREHLEWLLDHLHVVAP